jgi:transcription initiation factor IIF auxiliary subunit
VQEVYVVQVELGHKADFKPEVMPNGFTHDWTVFVRSVESAKIEHFVEKVVFHLHPSFKNPKRGKFLQKLLLGTYVYVSTFIETELRCY